MKPAWYGGGPGPAFDRPAFPDIYPPPARYHRIEHQIVMKGGHEPVCPPFARNRTEQCPEKAAVRFRRVSHVVRPLPVN
jgi:hypothetical protein